MKTIGEFTLLKKLGNGNFGVVYSVIKTGCPGKTYAAKFMRRDFMDQPQNKQVLLNEINILKELNHPNIYKIIDVKANSNCYILLTEYVNGYNLTECMKIFKKKYNRTFTEQIIQYLMRQIIDAFKYIHQKDIMHRDVKAANIMVSFDNEKDKNDFNILKATVKIIDFGAATKGL